MDRTKSKAEAEPEVEPFEALAFLTLFREKKDELVQLASQVQSKEELVKQQQAAEAALSNNEYLRSLVSAFWRIHSFPSLLTKENFLSKSVTYLQTDRGIKAREISLEELQAESLAFYQDSALGRNEDIFRKRVEAEKARLFEESPHFASTTFNEMRRRQNHFHSRTHQWTHIRIESEPFWFEELQMRLKFVFQTQNYGLDDEYSVIKVGV